MVAWQVHEQLWQFHVFKTVDNTESKEHITAFVEPLKKESLKRVKLSLWVTRWNTETILVAKRCIIWKASTSYLKYGTYVWTQNCKCGLINAEYRAIQILRVRWSTDDEQNLNGILYHSHRLWRWKQAFFTNISTSCIVDTHRMTSSGPDSCNKNSCGAWDQYTRKGQNGSAQPLLLVIGGPGQFANPWHRRSQVRS